MKPQKGISPNFILTPKFLADTNNFESRQALLSTLNGCPTK